MIGGMKLPVSLAAVLFAVSAPAQTNPWFYQPLPKVAEYLRLTDAALAAQPVRFGGGPPFLHGPGWTALLDGRTLAGWRSYGKRGNEWMNCKAIAWNAADPKRLACAGGPGDRILNGPNNRTDNIFTGRAFGDAELYVEFMLAEGSNSGVYLHGLYEVQIFDSFETADPLKTSDNGAIYHRWIDGKPVGGSPPRVNASLAPGQWQSFHVWFRAPRFDASGRKIENAKFLRVVHNGAVVQEDVEVEGPTRAHMDRAEAPENPLMLQGDHGPVAFRNIYIRPLP